MDAKLRKVIKTGVSEFMFWEGRLATIRDIAELDPTEDDELSKTQSAIIEANIHLRVLLKRSEESE